MNNNLTANAISIPVSFTHNCAYLFSADILLIHFSSIMCNDDWFALVTLQRFLVKDILRQTGAYDKIIGLSDLTGKDRIVVASLKTEEKKRG